jgi:hypothetical protein
MRDRSYYEFLGLWRVPAAVVFEIFLIRVNQCHQCYLRRGFGVCAPAAPPHKNGAGRTGAMGFQSAFNQKL